jgi:nucleoside-diphosphate-sugar epimerase
MYLVTGGAGFIGCNIVRRLLAMGEKVRVLDDFSTGKKENLAGVDRVDIVEGSLADLETVKRALEGIEYVLHQGAIPSVPRSVADPLGSSEANVTGNN